MARDDLQYLDISDFTPGIHQLASPAMPPGAADSATTYGCYASPRRGLTGLPDAGFSYTPASPNPGTDRAQINGFLVVPATKVLTVGDLTRALGGQFLRSDDLESAGPHHSVAFILGYEWLTTTPSRRMVLKLAAVVANAATPPETTIIDVTDNTVATTQADVWHTFLSLARSVGDTTVGGARANTEVGDPVVVASRVAITDTGNKLNNPTDYLIMFPDPTIVPSVVSPSILQSVGPLGASGSVRIASSAGRSGRMIIHQGRVLTLEPLYMGTWGDSSRQPDAGFYAGDILSYTESNDFLPDVTGIAYADKPYGIGTWASLTASDLIMITHADGAVLVQGDLNAPIVRRLPGVVSTRGLECEGTPSAVGFVYGVGAGGVYAWQGDDSSKLLSPQLDDEFWVASQASRHRNHKGTFANWGNWVLCPNNWMLDLDTGSWWRIGGDPTDASYRPTINWQVSPNGAYAYGAVPYFDRVGGVNQPAVYGYKRNAKQAVWKWQSWPLFQTDHRRIEVREILLTAYCTQDSTITVTLQGAPSDTESSSTSVTYTFSAADGTYGHTQRKLIAWKGRNPKITIDHSAGDAAIMSLRIGYIPAEQIPAETA